LESFDQISTIWKKNTFASFMANLNLAAFKNFQIFNICPKESVKMGKCTQPESKNDFLLKKIRGSSNQF
jgi:hypothetical protein